MTRHSAARAAAPPTAEVQAPLTRHICVLGEVLGARGQPLEPAVRAEMEQRFGADFSQVRVHADAKAATSARSLGVRAWTQGQHIAFAEGRYPPHGSDTRRLLAHELAHVAQQSDSRPGTGGAPDRPGTAVSAGRAEEEARHAAAAAMAGSKVPALTRHPIGVQCAPDQGEPAAAPDMNRPELAFLDSSIVGAIGSRALGDVGWPFTREFFRGLLGTILGQPGGRLERIIQRFADLYSLTSHFSEKWEFIRGYAIGILDGLWTSLKGTFEGLWFLVTLPFKALEFLTTTLPNLIVTYGARLAAFAQQGGSLGQRLRTAVDEMIRDPAGTVRAIRELFGGLFNAGLAQARQIGGRAASAALEYLEEPWPKLGRDIGKVAGMVLFEVLLFVFTDAIGNAVKTIGGLVGRLGARVVAEAVSLFRRIGALAVEAAEAIGRMAGRVGGRLSELLQEFAAWLRGLRQPLEDVAEAAGAERAAARSVPPPARTPPLGEPPPPGGGGPAAGGTLSGRPGQNVLVVGAERAEEFSYATEVAGRGHQVTVVNPLVTEEARAFSSRGGNFVRGAVEDLPARPEFDLIREDFPFPLGRAFQPTQKFVAERLTRLAPGGRWVVVTEDAEFVSTLEAAAGPEIQTTVREFPVFHEAAPQSVYPRQITRFVLIFEKAR